MTGQPLSEEREQEILELIADFPMPHGEGKRYVWPGIADELMAEIDRLRAEVARLEELTDSSWTLSALASAERDVEGLKAKVARLEAAGDALVNWYHRWSEDANDGEFALYREDEFFPLIIALREVLRGGGRARDRSPWQGGSYAC